MKVPIPIETLLQGRAMELERQWKGESPSMLPAHIVASGRIMMRMWIQGETEQ